MTQERMRLLVVSLCVALLGGGVGYEIAPSVSEQVWCCDDGGCTPVDYMSDCGADQDIFYCEWGQSTEQSGPNGESGWECLEQ